ncbi:MAG: histidinol-phosphate transaminase [Arcobacteraceae bacterium]|nr:histidinol-phosphate transaminase [Arcobacteraceae bacterium]
MNFNSVLDNMTSYEAGKPIELVVREFGIDPKDVVKLASNENPYGTSPKVTAKLQEISHKAFLYPDDSFYELKDSLAKKFQVDSKNIIIGSGSDQVLEFCVHAKCTKGSKVLMSKTTFAMYEIYSKHVGATILRTPSHHHDLDEFREIYKNEGADIIFLCLPNNPLGECLDKEDVYKFLDEVASDTLVILDCAYGEYAKYKDSKKEIVASDVTSKYPNVIYLGTFSKAYALGGMRVGYGIANTQIISTLNKVRPPFNITTLSLASAIEALKDEEFVSECIAKSFTEMARYEEFAKENNIEFIPSYTNFITYYLEGFSSKEVANKLLQRGMIIRDLTSYGLNAIRITIGTNEQNSKFFAIFKEVIA